MKTCRIFKIQSAYKIPQFTLVYEDFISYSNAEIGDYVEFYKKNPVPAIYAETGFIKSANNS